ncbi:MAG TPA: hypothetical protein VLM11_14935 [Streptosporangiaceae bacterium]|nr:hypothetical protein [Streptosporangiaceae bacterium]
MAVFEDVPAAIRRRTVTWRWSGVVAGVVAAVAATLTGALGRGLLLAAPLFGLFVLAGVLAGELSVPSPAGRTRRAAVAVRRATDYLPRGLTSAVALAAAGLVALLSMTTAMGSADDLGRAGRFLVRQCSAALTEGHGAWAGSFYSVPLGVVVVVGLAGAAIALRQVVRRPRPGDPADLTAADDQLRRRAARTIIGACGVLVAVPLIATSLVTAAGFLSIGCRPAWWTAAAWLLVALLPGWTTVLAWSGLAVLAPQRQASAHAGA